MSELTLRPATTADTAALSRLGTESFVAAFGDMYSPEDLAVFLTETKSEVAIAAQIADPAGPIQLATRDGRLLGYCKLGLACGWPEYARGTAAMELKQLYMDAAATGLGIGALLMDWAMAELAARGADEVQLSVFSGNHGAQQFYARYGFEKIADVTFRVGAQIDHEFLFARML
jgi:ribosomal protein S18 acetylase RimI-like enzyme